MSDLESAKLRYMNDPTFHTLVNTITQWYLDQDATPSEVRSAAMLAAIRAEQVTIRLPTYEYREGEQG